MARTPTIAPRVAYLLLPISITTLLVAFCGLLYLGAGHGDPRLVVAFAVMTAITVPAGAVGAWITWCLSHAATRAMASRYRQLRSLAEMAAEQPVMAGSGVTILATNRYSRQDGGDCDMFVRLPARLPRELVMVSRAPGAQPAELFILHAEMPVVRRRFAAVVVVGDRVVIERVEEPRQPRGVRQWLAYTRKARADGAVASLSELDELVKHLRAGLGGTATVIPLRSAGTR